MYVYENLVAKDFLPLNPYSRNLLSAIISAFRNYVFRVYNRNLKIKINYSKWQYESIMISSLVLWWDLWSARDGFSSRKCGHFSLFVFLTKFQYYYRYHYNCIFLVKQAPNSTKGVFLTLTCQSIANLQDLYGFFSTLGATWPPHNFDTAERDVSKCLAEIETVLSADFLEKMPASAPSTRWNNINNNNINKSALSGHLPNSSRSGATAITKPTLHRVSPEHNICQSMSAASPYFV